MEKMDGLSRSDSTNFPKPLDSSTVSSSKKGLRGRRSSTRPKSDVKGASRESENILGKPQGNIAGKSVPKAQKNLKDGKVSFLKKAEVKVGKFKNIAIPRLDFSKIVRGSSEAEELTPRDDEERGDYSPGKLQEGQHLPQGDDIHKAFLKPMHPRNIDVSKAPLPPPLPQAAEQLAAKQGKGGIEDNLNVLPNLVQIDEDSDLEIEGQNQLEAKKGAKFTSFGNSDMNQALSAVKSLKSLSEQSKSQQARLAPVREELMDQALSKLETAQKNLAATNQAIKEVLDELKTQPGAEKFSQRITDLNKKIHEVDGVTLRQSERLREYGGVQIAYGNRNLADQLGMDLKELAPSLQRQMRTLAGLATEDAKLGMQNILEYVASGAHWDIPANQLSDIVQTARQAGVQHPSLVNRPTHSEVSNAELETILEAGTEGNPAQSSVAKFLHSVLTGPSEDAFVWGAGSIAWGKEGLNGVRPFDIMANKYSQLPEDHRLGVLTLAQKFMGVGSSIPVNPANRARFESDMRQLIENAKTDSVPEHAQLAKSLERQLNALPKATAPERAVETKTKDLKNLYDFSKATPEQFYGDISAFMQASLSELNVDDQASIDKQGKSSDAVAFFIGHQILSKPSQSLNNYKKAIDAAQIALDKNDFATAGAILMTLNQGSITRLKMEDQLNESEKNKLTNLANTIEMSGNYSVYRSKIKQLQENGVPFIPFVGAHTQAFVFANDGNPDSTADGELNTYKLDLIGGLKQQFHAIQAGANSIKKSPSPQQKQFLSDIAQFQQLKAADDFLYDESYKIKPRPGRR